MNDPRTGTQILGMTGMLGSFGGAVTSAMPFLENSIRVAAAVVGLLVGLATLYFLRARDKREAAAHALEMESRKLEIDRERIELERESARRVAP